MRELLILLGVGLLVALITLVFQNEALWGLVVRLMP
jgi:hypothetical protein